MRGQPQLFILTSDVGSYGRFGLFPTIRFSVHLDLYLKDGGVFQVRNGPRNVCI